MMLGSKVDSKLRSNVAIRSISWGMTPTSFTMLFFVAQTIEVCYDSIQKRKIGGGYLCIRKEK